MHRRELLAAAALATAGCVGGGEASDSTPTKTPGVMNPTYEGVHESHAGAPIERAEHHIHNACKATVYVWFEEEPNYDDTLAVWFYKNGENVERGTIGMSEPEVEDRRQKFPFQFCAIDKYDAYKVGVLTR